MEIFDSVIFSQLTTKFEARLEKTFEQLKHLRLLVESCHRCGERFWQFQNSVDTVKKTCRKVVVCQLLKGQQNLVCFNCRKCILTADLLSTGKAFFSVFLKMYWLPRELLSPCRGSLPGENFLISGSRRDLLQDENHSGYRPHFFPGLSHMRSGTSSDRFQRSREIAGSMRKSSGRETAPKSRFFVLLNS